VGNIRLGRGSIGYCVAYATRPHSGVHRLLAGRLCIHARLLFLREFGNRRTILYYFRIHADLLDVSPEIIGQKLRHPKGQWPIFPLEKPIIWYDSIILAATALHGVIVIFTLTQNIFKPDH